MSFYRVSIVSKLYKMPHCIFYDVYSMLFCSTAGFYRSLDTAVSEPFLPSQHLSALRTKRKTPPYFSARRNLSSDMERHENRIMPYENGTAQYENGTEWYKNRTIPYENETTRYENGIKK